MAEHRLGGDVKGAFALAVVCAVVAALANNAAVGWLLAPGYVGGALYAAFRAPLRYSIYVLTFCAFAVEKPNEMPVWLSPLYPIGSVLFTQLKHSTGFSFLFLSGIEYFIYFLLALAGVRMATGSKMDSAGRTQTPDALIKLAYVSLIGSGFTWFYGLATGGDFSKSLWQMTKVVYVPLVFFLCHHGLRGPRDHVILGKIILAAAAIRAGLAIYIVQTLDPSVHGGELEHATSHHDSMLFASACVLLILLIVERATAHPFRWFAMLAPLLAWGMVSNARRMVWVQIALVMVTLYFVTPPHPIKRKVRRLALLMSPLLAGYVAAGWNSQASVFAPVQTIRSVVEPSTDMSSLWREIENYDLLATFRHAPVFGHGYGHRFWEVIPLPAVPFDLEYYLPHNSILGLWAFAGFVGFTTLTLLWAGGVFFAMRGYLASKSRVDRVAAVMCIGSVLIYMTQCFGDMGLGAWTGVFLLAPSISLAGKLAVSAQRERAALAKEEQRASQPPATAVQPVA